MASIINYGSEYNTTKIGSMCSSHSVSLNGSFEEEVWPGSMESFIDQIKDYLNEERLYFLKNCPKINISAEQGSCEDGAKLVAIPSYGGGSGYWEISYNVYRVESDQTLSHIGSLYLGFDMYSGISQKPNTIQYSNNSGSIPVVS